MPADISIEHRAPEATPLKDGRGWRRSFSSLLWRLHSFSAWLDDSWLGAAFGALVIFAFMITVPVLLPLVAEVLK